MESRIADYSALLPIVKNASVSLRGWDFPHIDPHVDPQRDVDWVGQESEWQQFLEIWRLYQSGQFVDLVGMPWDWRDRSDLWPADRDWKPGTSLGVMDALFRFTEIHEFAARLALTEGGDDFMHIEVTVGGLRERALRVDSHDRVLFFQTYKASLDELPYEHVVPRSELVAQPRELALRPASELFARFGWQPSQEMLRDLQRELWK